MTDSLSPVSPGLADLIASVAWTADPKNGRFGMTLEQEEVELLAQHFARQSPMVATAAAAERREELLPANVKALELSIASVDRFMDSDDAHILIPEHGEAILLILHELKRLRASTDATPRCHQSPLMTENAAGRASTYATPVACKACGGTKEVSILRNDGIYDYVPCPSCDTRHPATDTAQAEPTQRRLAEAEGAQQNEADGAEALYRGPC